MSARRKPKPSPRWLGTILELHHKRNNRARTYVEAKRDLEKDAIKAWGKRPIASIAKCDVIRLIDGIVQRGAEVVNRTLAQLRALFRWAVEKDRMAVSPAAALKLPTQEHERDRVLKDDELRWLSQGCEETGWSFGRLVQVLLLTGQRRNEVAAMQHAELDLTQGLWAIPAAAPLGSLTWRRLHLSQRKICSDNRDHLRPSHSTMIALGIQSFRA